MGTTKAWGVLQLLPHAHLLWFPCSLVCSPIQSPHCFWGPSPKTQIWPCSSCTWNPSVTALCPEQDQVLYFGIQNPLWLLPYLPLALCWGHAQLLVVHTMLLIHPMAPTPAFTSFCVCAVLSTPPCLARSSSSFKHSWSHLLQEAFWRSSHCELNVSYLSSLLLVPCAHP